MQIYLYAISFLLSLGACKNEPKQAGSYKNEKRNSNDSSKKLVSTNPTNSSEPANKAVFNYNLQKPDATFELHEELWEVSGIEWTKENGILAVQDEGGFVYFLNEQAGTMQKELNFAPKGDYESVRLVNGVIWVLQADGLLHKIQNCIDRFLFGIIYKSAGIYHHNIAFSLVHHVFSASFKLAHQYFTIIYIFRTTQCNYVYFVLFYRFCPH